MIPNTRPLTTRQLRSPHPQASDAGSALPIPHAPDAGHTTWSLRVSVDPTSYDERVLPSIGNEVLKATVAQFDGTSRPRFILPTLTSPPQYSRWLLCLISCRASY